MKLGSGASLVAAGVIALGCTTGGAVAGSMITGAQIKNGTVTGADVKDKSLATVDLSRATVSRLRGDRGPRGLPGAVRAWAHVAGDGSVLASSPGVTVVKSAAATGTYCLHVPGVDPVKTAPVVSLDYTLSGTSTGPNKGQGFTEVGNVYSNCASDRISVNTLLRTYTTTSGGQLSGTDLEHADQGFYVVVP